MKLTPELKKRIDDYFEQMTEEDLLKAFPDMLEEDSIYSSEKRAIESGATGYIACKQGSCYFVIDTSKGYNENSLLYNSTICNAMSREIALEIINLYNIKDKSSSKTIDLDFVKEYLAARLLSESSVFNMFLHSFVESYNIYVKNGKEDN